MKIESFRACVSSLRGGDRSRMRCSIGTKGLLFFLGALVAFLLERRKPKLAEEFTLPVASGVLAGGSLMCGAGVLGQRRQHSQDALRRLTGHRAVVVTPPTAATTTRHLLDGPQTNLLCPLTVACFPTLVTPLAQHCSYRAGRRVIQAACFDQALVAFSRHSSAASGHAVNCAGPCTHRPRP